MEYKFLEPIKVGEVQIKNRIMYLAMAKMLSNLDGTVSEKDIAYIKSIAEGGVGVIVPGAMVIDPEWPSVLPMQFGIYSDHFITGLQTLTETSHAAGSKIFFQLWHPGQVAYSASKTPPTVNDLTIEQIHEIQNKYVLAAQRAKKAGADGIEFQICHNYLAAQFLSPLFNHRTDEYGIGSVDDQIRFSVETIALIKKAIGPELALSVKLQGSDEMEGGITVDLATKVAPKIEEAGASMICVSAGGTLTGLNSMSGDCVKEDGWKVPLARAVKQVVNIPVCATDTLRKPGMVDKIIRDGSCDMVGMGRTIFAEREWVKKVKEGRENELRYCISCMNCFNYTMIGRSGCNVNPFALRELEQKPLTEDGKGRTVVIVGAGPAGLEAAVTLAERNFKPIVFESEGTIGGMLRLAKNPPHKERIGWMIDYYEDAIKRLSIDIKLNTLITLEMINNLNPYAVVISAGTKESKIPIPGVDGENVYQSRDVLLHNQNFTGKNVTVIGAGLTGIESALLLAETGNQVTVLDILDQPNMKTVMLPMGTPIEMLFELERAIKSGIDLKYKSKICEITNNAVIAENIETNEKIVIASDVVVLSTGVKANTDLYDKLISTRSKVYKIGDANFIGKIGTAVTAGNKLGYTLR